MAEAAAKSLKTAGTFRGVHQAFNTLPQPVMRPVGKVLFGYVDRAGSGWAVACVNELTHPRLCVSILAGSLKSVSLTTCVEGTIMPLELSLCTFPARPGSWVAWATRSLQTAVSYKLLAAARGTPVTMEPVPAAAPKSANPFKDILGKLDPADRSIIEARFTEVMATLDGREKDATHLKTQLDSMRVASAADKVMLAEQIKLFMSGAGAKYSEPYALRSCASTICDSNDANDVRRAVDRMLTVANRAHADSFNPNRAAVSGEAPSKRARFAAPAAEVAAPPAVEAAVPVPDDRSPLQRAFANTFA